MSVTKRMEDLTELAMGRSGGQFQWGYVTAGSRRAEPKLHLLDPRRLGEDRLPAVCGAGGVRFVVDNHRDSLRAGLQDPDLCGKCRAVIERLDAQP